MRYWLDRARSSVHQLTDKTSYVVSLQAPKPSSCIANPSCTRPLPALPFGSPEQYTLVKPLQTGVNYGSQVWLAAPPGQSHHSPAVSVVFKFVIPSLKDIPRDDLNDMGVFENERRYFVFPYDEVNGEAASYASLVDLQGSTVPYFYGVHEVLMPWGEPGWMLALEWIPGLPGSLYVLNKELAGGGDTKYRDHELFMRLFHSALDTLQRAYARNVVHTDVRSANILIDGTYNQAVIIDWASDFSPDPCSPLTWHTVGVRLLKTAFVESGIQPQCSEIRRICNELEPLVDSDSESESQCR